MSDSFADLWNSAGPAKPAQQAVKLGAAAATGSTVSRRPQYDAFAMLASTGTNPNSRSTTPSGASMSSQKPSAKPITSTSSGDAFSGLFSNGFGEASANANLSIAERAAKVERERREALMKQQAKHQEAAKQHAHTWAGLDGLESLAKSTSTPAPAPPPVAQDDDWLFGSAPPAKPAASVKVTAATEDDWGLDDFVSHPAPSKSVTPVQPSQPKSVWDLDDLTSSSKPVSGPSHSNSRSHGASRSSTPGDFDFGDREDALLDDNSQDEDDILGDLARPAHEVRRRPSPAHTPPQPPNGGSGSRAPSPPPHLIGQIVEMGFSPQQARIALASTSTGLDVQAALETLLANGAGASDDEPSRSERSPRQRERPEHRYDSDEFEEPPERHRSEDNLRPSAARPRRHDAAEPSREELDLQAHADKLIAQASTIGLSMFNKANAFWKDSKEKAQKLYEERAAAKATGSRAPTDGRPRWLQEALDRDEAAHEHGGEIPESASHGEDALPPRPIKQRPSRADAAPQPQVTTGDLFSDDAPQAYVSPYRRKRPSHAASAPVSSAATPARPPSPIRLTQRKTISASPAEISVSAKHKASGTEMYKLGRYAEAETAYSAAISKLPEQHLLLVPLLNNRALTRLKTGDTSGAIEDSTTVITMIGTSYHPSREAKVTKEEDGASVDLADALVKAWRRRAEAYEGKEKWDLARKDWEAIAGADFAGKTRSEAVTGIGRCRKMLNANKNPEISSGGAMPPAAPKPAAPAKVKRPIKRVPTPPSEALNRLKKANQEAEAEDQARYELKDSVDAKLNAWKGGKETNLRALIASLDTVLWPELGWQKVGLHEVVTPNQVKIRYTKAIAKLHPDKLNTKNTTVEQRMIANGVFGSLNDAWNAFKP
ncbi:hypothetical protein EVG20_g4179 [Dentipellis fragilis]|uniref:UBA domain-containing protein n=1 Tax=Dentipellis fragilis TaxID=205917 RepID=A0A4Y9YWF6_9AGAM|nr:hypothetical protein EVG20_g4179 [Dentipellis fragilis]